LDSNKRLVNLSKIILFRMALQKITKEEIIRIGIELFRKQGYNRTSMNDLAMACGLQKGSFYHYFSSKEALMSSILDTLYQYYRNKIFSLAFDQSQTPLLRMETFFKKQEPVFTQDLTGCLFGNITLETISMEEEFKSVIQAFFSDWIEAFKQIFLDDGNNEDESLMLARQSVMEIEGALMMMRVFADVEILKQACERVMGRFRTIDSIK
jgi:TetR/AcrR family transcriptional repressor of nem operon